MNDGSESAELKGDWLPAHAERWAMFWQEDMCEKDHFHTWFPRMTLTEAQTVWMRMEALLSQYSDCLRVWPEWYSSGIWRIPYPGSRSAGGMIRYDGLPIPEPLVERFRRWQEEYNESPPCGEREVDWDRFDQTADALAAELKRCVGPEVYVERRELHEILMDGSVRSLRPILGLAADLDAVTGIRRGLDQAKKGLGRPVDDVFDDLERNA